MTRAKLKDRVSTHPNVFSSNCAMGRLSCIFIALVVLFHPLSGAAEAQFTADLCRSPVSTIMLMRLSNNVRVVLALTREGDRIRGSAQAWQPNGVSAGRAVVDGVFGGTTSVGRGFSLTASWEGPIAQTSWLQGRLREGIGAGTSSNGIVRLTMQVSPMKDCAGWPEQRFAPVRCVSGYVWREAGRHDFACVPPSSRDRTRKENQLADSRRDPNGPYGPLSCRPGFVWREAYPADTVCVPPRVRQIVRDENRLAGRRRS